MLPKPLQDLEKLFRKLPGIGPRQASRFSFFLLKQPETYVDDLIISLKTLKNDVDLCKNCYMPTEKSQNNLCPICSDEKRDKNIIYLVEKEADALNLEQVSSGVGVYFVLGEAISPIGEHETAKKRLKDLIKKLRKNTQNTEVILALSNTREGNYTTMYIEKMFEENDLLKNKYIKLARLGRGLSTGGDLEYADEETLKNALKNRS